MGQHIGLTNIRLVGCRVRTAADQMRGLFRLRTRTSCLQFPALVAWLISRCPGSLTRPGNEACVSLILSEPDMVPVILLVPVSRPSRDCRRSPCAACGMGQFGSHSQPQDGHPQNDIDGKYWMNSLFCSLAREW